MGQVRAGDHVVASKAIFGTTTILFQNYLGRFGVETTFVPLTDYGTPSTNELTEAMRPFVKHHNALLMANHGAVAYGTDLWQAFDRLETLEHTARIAILARALGGANDLPKDAVSKLVRIREKAGYLPEKARCQACGYLQDSGVECEIHEGNGAKISLSREELIELLAQAANVG